MANISVELTGETMKAARKAMGLRQQDVAQAMGVGWRTVARWEGGGKIPLMAQKLFRILIDVEHSQTA